MMRRVVPAAAVVVVSVAVVVLVALLDRATVTAASGLGILRFGGPFGWLGQDQSVLDPPLPFETRPLGPWEHPTSVAWLPFVTDVAIVAVVVALMYSLAARVLRSHRSPATTALARA
ncbi:hypothetical protein [Cellulomonas rhizosphaerae]|uniref:DUF1461 domain-containing protein n=1 Tax=Cellulomonas rhizosphaerae TaxID=2293719 RepID=A0A413RI99_9CELL|nr:hypothetical protein [Cellulomonas rhizosphaerae]RHA37984.1 hypothetical protein D1825_15435 [Cellulomonas rhizosphaerae]